MSAPVERIAPAAVPKTLATAGKNGVIVGFGRSDGSLSDVGLKRQGAVKVTACTSEHANREEETSVCWTYQGEGATPGTDSNTCNGDSGGPLFVNWPLKTAGTTMNGTQGTCRAPDYAYDVRLSKYYDWISEQSGPTFGAKACGGGPQIGTPGAMDYGISDVLNDASAVKTHTVALKKQAKELRLSLGGWVSKGAALKFEVLAPNGSKGCSPQSYATFAYCSVADAQRGTWTLRVSMSIPGSKPERAQAAVQLLATVLD